MTEDEARWQARVERARGVYGAAAQRLLTQQPARHGPYDGDPRQADR